MNSTELINELRKAGYKVDYDREDKIPIILLRRKDHNRHNEDKLTELVEEKLDYKESWGMKLI